MASSSYFRVPPEVLSKIFLELDYSNLLNTRFVCKQFFEATKTRQLWLSHVQKLKERFGYVLPFEESTYTAEELERWVSTRQRVLEMWSKSSPTGAQTRSFDTSTNQFHFQFLPGGRWILSSGSEGIVFLLDTELITTSLDPIILFDSRSAEIDSQFKKHPFERSHWIDRSKPHLSFVLATTFSNNSTKISRTCISRVELSGRTSNTTFSAQQLVTFEHKVLYQTRGTALNSCFFVALRDSGTPSGDAELTVFDYSVDIKELKDQTKQQSSSTFPVENVYWQVVSFTHENILVVAGRLKLFVLEVLPSVSPGKPPQVQQHHCIILTDGTMDVQWNTLSPIQCFADASQFTIYESFSNLPLALVRIAHDKFTPPVFHAVSTRDSPVRQYSPPLILYESSWAALVNRSNGGTLQHLEVMKYCLDNMTSQCTLGHVKLQIPEVPLWSDVCALSAETGRLILVDAPSLSVTSDNEPFGFPILTVVDLV